MKKRSLRIVVTGGAGLIGSWVIDALLKEWPKKIGSIVVFDNFTRGTKYNLQNALKSKKVKVVKGDVRDVKQVDRVIKGADYVVHEAAIRITQCAQEPRLGHEVLVDGTFNVFEACAKHKVQKIVFNSSASVYGNPSYLPMDEEHPYNNDTLYGAAKIANEHLARSFRAMYGMNYVCLRPFNVYGPRMDVFGVYTEVLIRWLDRIDQGQPPVIFGDGKQALDFVYVGDVARATLAALTSKVNGGVYNVGTGKMVSLNGLVKTLLKLTNSKFKPIYEPQRIAAHVSRRKASIHKAKRDLGFVAKTSLAEGLKELIAWRRAVIRQKS